MLHSFGDGGRERQLYCPAGLMRLARSRCGDVEAADPTPFAGLDILCAAFETARPAQTSFGKIHAQTILLDAIAKRLRLADYLRRFPEIATENLSSPIFIVAPFRTGTSFLHRLLACDPANRWPRLWEVAYPPPARPDLRREAHYFTDDARIAPSAAALRTLDRANPARASLHPMAVDLAEECFGLLETSFLSPSFMFYAALEPYFDWLDTRKPADWRAAYRIYADQLRLLQWWYPGRRWILKSPVHLWNIDVLLEIFPQAHIIQLHRDPADAMESFCRLLGAYRSAMCKPVSPGFIGEQARMVTAKSLQRAVAARRRSDARRFIDVDFADLIRDPVATAQAIYARIGIELTPVAAGMMRCWVSDSRPKQADTKARVGTYGLENGAVLDMFADYTGFLDTPSRV